MTTPEGRQPSSHPFSWLPLSLQVRVFLALLLLTLLVMIGMQKVGAPLRTDAAPLGIVTFEFAGDVATARQIVASWDDGARTAAGLSLGLDFLFLIAYASSMSLGCVLLGRRLFGRNVRWVAVLAWAAVAAGLLDAIENYALIQVLAGADLEFWPALSWWCAAVKFGIVGLGLAFLVMGGATALVRRST